MLQKFVSNTSYPGVIEITGQETRQTIGVKDETTAPTEISGGRPLLRTGPRERLMMNGARSLSDAELIAVLLGTGLPAEPVGVLAARLIETAGGLDRLERFGVSTLSKEAGIGPTKACRILAAFELGRRAAATPLLRGKPITCSKDVVSALKPRLSKEPREHFLVIALDLKNRPISEIEVAIGSLGACAVKPADVFRPVLREPSSAVVLVHNHPSGEPSPSSEDISFTKSIARAGEMLGIRVLDHIIVAEAGYFSFLDGGLLLSGNG